VSASASLDAVASLVPFLRARRSRPGAGDVLGADLIADPELLRDSIATSADARGSEDPQVLASLWWQGYCYRLAGTTLAAWVVAGSAPDPSASAGAGVGVERGRPSSLVVGPRAREVGSLDRLLDHLFPDHLDPVADRLREVQPIGTRLVWGNADAAIASCLSAVATAPDAPTDLHGRVDEVVAALPEGIGRLGSWLAPQHRRYHRSTCCLWWKTTTAAGGYCSDCSLLDPSEVGAP
jgi:ferric iron reductase protein FhuF